MLQRIRSGSGDKLSIGLAIVAAACLLVAELSVYADHAIFDSASFADRATSTLDDESVRAEIGDHVTDEAVRAAPNLIAVRPLIQATADGAIGSPQFQALLRDAVEDVHRTLFGREQDTVTLKVADTEVLVASALRQLAPSVGRRIPEDLDVKLLAISDDGPDGWAADLGQIADDNHRRSLVALLAAAVLFAFALLVAPNRLRAAWRIGIAIAVAGALVVVTLYVARALVVGQGADDEARGAIRAVWGAFLGDLRTWSLFLCGTGLMTAAAASTLQRPVPLASLARRARDVVTAPSPEPWQRGLRSAGLVAAGMVAILKPGVVLDVAVILAGAAMVYLGVSELVHLALTWDRPKVSLPRPQLTAPSRRWRVAAAGVGLAAILGLGLLGVAAADRPEEPPFEIRACNGRADLCDLRVDQVVFPSTHNSMSAATEPSWIFANQNDGVPEQLGAGVRGLLIDTHYGVQTKRGVYTVLEKGKSKEKLAGALGEEGLRAAERLRRQIGYRGGGKREVYWCHAFCELGATGGVKLLEQVRDFMATHPYEVVLMSIEDDVSPKDTEAIFKESGLLDYVYQGRLSPMPTLRELVEGGERLIVMGEEHTGDVPWFHPQFDFVQETPYDFSQVEQLERPESCDPGRGRPGNPMLLLNHWVDTSPAPRATNARRANSRRVLLRRVRLCGRLRHRLPNLLAVDLYREGDLFGVAAELNRHPG